MSSCNCSTRQSKKPVLCIDLDGVIATGSVEEVYSGKAGWAYDKCTLVEGAKAGLEQLCLRYDLFLYTARWGKDTVKTFNWLEEQGIAHLFKKISIGEKPSAVAYIDDRGYKFENWSRLITDFMERAL